MFEETEGDALVVLAIESMDAVSSDQILGDVFEVDVGIQEQLQLSEEDLIVGGKPLDDFGDSLSDGYILRIWEWLRVDLEVQQSHNKSDEGGPNRDFRVELLAKFSLVFMISSW